MPGTHFGGDLYRLAFKPDLRSGLSLPPLRGNTVRGPSARDRWILYVPAVPGRLGQVALMRELDLFNRTNVL